MLLSCRVGELLEKFDGYDGNSDRDAEHKFVTDSAAEIREKDSYQGHCYDNDE